MGWLSAIGSIFSFLGTALKGLFTFIVFRQGEKAQASKDQTATLGTVEKERDAADQAGTAEDAAKQGKF
jgi:hypothetical protein